jgi:hypothetical protein
MIHSDFDKVGFAIKALKDYNPVYGNYSSPFQQPRFTLFGEISKVSKSKVIRVKVLSDRLNKLLIHRFILYFRPTRPSLAFIKLILTLSHGANSMTLAFMYFM